MRFIKSHFIKLIVLILIANVSLVRYFSVLFTDPVYDDDFIFKAEVLPKAL